VRQELRVIREFRALRVHKDFRENGDSQDLRAA
jgi:hypothetical protein